MFVSLKTGQAQCRSLLVCKFDVSALFKALAHGVVTTHTSAGFIDSELEKLGAAFWKRTLVFLLQKLLHSCIYTTIYMCPSTQELKPVLLLLLKPVMTHRGNFSLCSPSPWCCSQNMLLTEHTAQFFRVLNMSTHMCLYVHTYALLRGGFYCWKAMLYGHP